MNRRQQKKATKQAWHPLTMRVKLRNGKIRNRTWKLGGYLRYAKITYPPIEMNLIKVDMASVPPLCAGYWCAIKDYNSQNKMNQIGYRQLYGGML